MADNQAAPLDLQGLYALYGQETTQELLVMCVKEARDLMAQLVADLDKHDSKSLSANAHQLKGLAATMTLDELARLSKDLELAASQEDWAVIGELQCQLNDKFEGFCAYVSRVMGA